MPRYTETVQVSASRDAVWGFVKDVDNWAPMFPGYQRHLEVETDHFVWQIRGEAGVWSRLVEFEVTVLEWNDPNDVTFRIKGKTEPVEGTGKFFSSEGETPRQSQIGFELAAEGRGPTAPMMNALIDRFLTEQSRNFLSALCRKLESTNGAGVTEEQEDPLPTGPGTIFVTYEAPRTREFEEWMHGPHYDDLLRQPGVVGISRFERLGTSGGMGGYVALIQSQDLAATLQYRNSIGRSAQLEADSRGVVRGEGWIARPVFSKRLPWWVRLRKRLQGSGAPPGQ